MDALDADRRCRREERLADLRAKHVQPVKEEYVVVTEAPPPSSSRPSAPMMERKKKRAKTTDSMEHEKTLVGDPEGLANEKNKLPADVMHRLNRKNFKFEEERRYETSDLDPMNLREVKLIDFSDKVYVAPLTTVGNLPFRRIMVDMGADITCGEMAMAANLCEGQPSEWALLRRHECEKIFGVQIACGNGDQMGRCCELVKKYCEVDFVDVNMGCPIDPICNKGCGSTLMKKRGKAESVVKSALATLDCAVTFKIRTGWLDSEKTAHTTIGLAQSWQARGRGVSAVFLHGRSRSQRYSKLADWSYVERVVNSQDDAAAPLPVIGNGDVLSYQDWEEKRATAPHAESCAMLARGALIKPWLATEIKERRTWDISSSERFDILKDFVKYGLEHWGSDNCGIARTRRFLLEWLSFLHRYTPAGILEVLPQRINERPPKFVGRNDLETLMASPLASDWIKISEMLLGPVPDGYNFEAKHKSSSYAAAAAASRAGSDWGPSRSVPNSLKGMLTIFMAVAVSTVTLGPRSFVNAQTESPTFIEYDETWWPTASSEFLATSEENDTLALNVTDFPTLAPTELTIVFPAPTTPFPSASPTLPGPTTAQPATTPAPSIFPQAAPSTARPQGGGSSGDKKKGSSNDSTVMIIILVVVIIVAIFAAMCCAIVVLRKREKQQSGQRPDRQRYTTPSPSAQPRPLSTGSYCDVDDEGRSVRRTTVTSETADLRDAFYEDEDAISMTSITSDKMEPALRRLIHQEEGMLQDAHEMGMENVLRTS